VCSATSCTAVPPSTCGNNGFSLHNGSGCADYASGTGCTCSGGSTTGTCDGAGTCSGC
jgi:hypothetical protein